MEFVSTEKNIEMITMGIDVLRHFERNADALENF